MFSLVHEHCDKISCPVCHQYAEKRLASRGRERLEGMKALYEERGDKFGPLDHVVFSPPIDLVSEEDANTKEGYDKLHDWANRFLNSYVRGLAGCYMLHPWRAKHHDGSTCEDENCHQRHYWHYGPHFHYLGYGYWLKSSTVYDLTGAVYTKIKYGQKRDAFKTLAYEANHCGVLVEETQITEKGTAIQGTKTLKQKGKIIRWVGKFATCKGGFKKEGIREEVEICEKCQHEIHQYSIDYDTGKPFLWRDIGQSIKLVTYGHWHLNLRQAQKKLGSNSRRVKTRRNIDQQTGYV